MNSRRLPLALALGLLLAAPAAAAPQKTALPGVETTPTVVGPVLSTTLPNGLKVLLKENHASPVVSWVVTYKVGSRNESLGTTGSAHLLEHMMFKGTKTLGKGQVAQLLERNGADSNAGTWVDWTTYYETYGSDKLALGLEVEAARMRGALIRDDERQSEMTVVRNELERGESNPGRLLYQSLLATAFVAHPYHHPTIGWRSDVEGVSTAALKQFYDTYYQPNNAVAVLVGDFKPATALPMIKKYFGGIPRGKTPPPVITREEPQTGERRVILRRRGETNQLQLGYHIPAVGHADIGPLLVLDSILSNGITGRLYQALVETEVATSAFTDVGITRDPGIFRAGATLKPGASHADVEKALEAVLEKVRETPVSEAELAKAKRQAEASTIYENEGTYGLASSLAHFEAIGGWRRSFTLLDDIRKVSASQIQAVAKRYLGADNRTVAWYVATPDGPVPPAPMNAGKGTAVGAASRPIPAAPFAFEQKPAPARPLTRPFTRTLPNGLRLVVLPNPSSQTIAVSGYVQAGSLLAPQGKEGVADATASLLDAGTSHHDKLALAELLEGVSASVSADAGVLTTSLGASMIAKDRALVLGALAEELREPTFPPAELAKLKNRWIAGIRRGEDSPGTRASRAFSQAVYAPTHPFYQRDPAEAIKQIEAITVDDLKAFHDKHYGPNTTTLVVVGRVEPAQVAAQVESLFAGWKAAEPGPLAVPKAPLTAPTHVRIPMPDQTNVEIRVGHGIDVKRSDKDYYALSLANYVLGGDPLTGRLGLKLRDQQGLTYGTGSTFGAGFGEGAWYAAVTVNPANVEKAETSLKSEVASYLKGGMTSQELAFAKSSFIGSQAVGLATNGGMAGGLSSILLYDLGLDYWQRYPQIIRGVSLADVNAAAKRLIHPEEAHTIEAGPVPALP